MKRTPLAHLEVFLGLYRPYFWTVVVYAAFVGLLALTTPVAVQALVNTAAFGTVLQPIVVLVLLLLLGLVFAGVLKALKAWVVEVVQRRLFLDAVARLAYLLPRVDVHAASTRGTAHAEHRFFEVFNIQKSLASLLVGGVDVVLATLVGLLVLAFYHPILLAFDAALILAMVVIVFLLGRGGVRSSIEESSAKYAVASFLTEVLQTGTAFRDGAGRDFARGRLDTLAAHYLESRGAHFRVVMRQIIGALATQAIASAALLGLGGYLVVERELTLGQLVAAEIIVTVVVSALSDLGKHLETYYDLVTSVYKLDGLLDLPAELEPDGGLPTEAQGPAALKIRDLHLTLGTRSLFVDASLSVQPGERIRLVGSAESGKSSLLALLFGIRRPDRGLIQLDGVDTRELSLEALRARVALVCTPELVSGTVIDNVLLGRTDIPVGRVRALLEEIGLAEELWRLPDGLDTLLGPGGTPITASQAFRLTLARALIRSPGLLAIDADLSAIDAQSLSRVMAVAARDDAPWTLIVVGDTPIQELSSARVVHLRAGQLHEGGQTDGQ
jgi:putative ABC transport system ATP-binding protein